MSVIDVVLWQVRFTNGKWSYPLSRDAAQRAASYRPASEIVPWTLPSESP